MNNDYRNDMNKFKEEASWTFWKFFLPILALIIIVSAVTWGLGIISQPAKMIEKTMDADNVIYNYEWFKTTYHYIDATQKKIATLENEKEAFNESAGPRQNWSFEDKNEYSRLSSTISGLKNYKNDLIAEYNAKSKMINRKIFKGGDLPPEIYE